MYTSERDLSGWWEDLGKAVTNVYRAANPFVEQNGTVSTADVQTGWVGMTTAATEVYRGINPFVKADGSLTANLTEVYREINPFVKSDGSLITGTGDLFREIGLNGLAEIQIKSIQDIPGISQIMDFGEDAFGIDWETSKSPTMRVLVPILVGAVLGVISGGLLAPLGAAIGIGTAAATTIGAAIGGGVGNYLAKDQVTQYLTRVATADQNKQIEQLNGDLKDLTILQTELEKQAAAGSTDAATALSDVKGAKAQIADHLNNVNGNTAKKNDIIGASAFGLIAAAASVLIAN